MSQARFITHAVLIIATILQYQFKNSYPAAHFSKRKYDWVAEIPISRKLSGSNILSWDLYFIIPCSIIMQISYYQPPLLTALNFN
jgi:hypothetical protein